MKKSVSGYVIVILNLIFAAAMAFAVVRYAQAQTRSLSNSSRQAFMDTVETAADIAGSYLLDSQDTCNNWAQYINAGSMTMEEAIEFVNTVNSVEDVSVHIIRCDTLEGLSSRPSASNMDDYTVSYEKLKASLPAIDERKATVNVSPRYTDPKTGLAVFSFGNKITLIDGEEEYDAYLLRVVPLSRLEERWALPTQYDDAVIALVEASGDYLVKPTLMKNESIYSFLYSFNQGEINENEIRGYFASNDSGAFTANVANGTEYFWGFSHLKVNSSWIIVSALPATSLAGDAVDWTIPIIVIAVVLVILAMDILYLSYMRQQEAKQKTVIAKQADLLKDALDRAEAANEAKTSFLSSMSHDIRTPMNGIIGMTAIAAAHIEDRDRVKDCLQKITQASKHLLSLINEVLDMSKIESGSVQLTEEDFNLADLIDNLLTMTRPQIEQHHHELSVSIDRLIHENVIGDTLHIQQIFVNLMSNAIKYTPDGGKISLLISEKPAGQSKVGCYEFVFEDNGIGMTEEFLTKIFEPFSRAEDPRTSKIQGTGLGMAITRNIVRMMNGDISVESKPGAGSKFTVTIYLKLQPDESVDCSSFADLPVLVADDDPIACETACTMLDDLGMKSKGALSGQEAVNLVKEHHEESNDFFAVILDWKMPGMDGLATTRAIRQTVGGNVPIIIISSYDWSEIEQEARAAGANAFISKPLFRSRLVYLFNELTGAAQPENAEPEKDVLPEELDLHGHRLLLAEDNDLNAEIAMEILGETGAEVERASDGSIALDMFEAHEAGYYDLIFMDVQMPNMNGYQATRAIRALDREDAKEIPVIAMTANAFAEDVHDAMSAGMNEHIAKPLDFNALVRVLNKWVLKKSTVNNMK